MVINGCYVSSFLDRIVTIRSKDWEKIKEEFFIPKDPLELEKKGIHLMQNNAKAIKYESISQVQRNLFSNCGEQKSNYINNK